MRSILITDIPSYQVLKQFTKIPHVNRTKGSSRNPLVVPNFFDATQILNSTLPTVVGTLVCISNLPALHVLPSLDKNEEPRT